MNFPQTNLSQLKSTASDNNEENTQQTIYIPQKFKVIHNISKQDEQQQVQEEKAFNLEDILKNNTSVVIAGSKGYGKTTFAKKIEEQIYENYQSQIIIPLYINAKSKAKFDFTQIIVEKNVIDDTKRMIILIDDFDDILFNHTQFFENKQNPFISQCKFIYFVNKSTLSNQVYQKWIQTENIIFQYEIIQFNKNDIKVYFENYLPWDQCISNIDLSLTENHSVVKSIVGKIENKQNIHKILIKIIKLSSVVDDLEQEAGNAMMILKQLMSIIQNEDFSLIRLKNSNFKHLSFINCNFEGSQMENVNISKCWFIQCNLNNVLWQNMIKSDTQLNLGERVSSYTFLNESSLFIVTFHQPRIELWHLKAGKRISCLVYIDIGFNEKYKSALSQNGRILAYQQYSYQTGKKIKIKNCSSFKILRVVKTATKQQSTDIEIYSIMFSHNNQFLAIVYVNALSLWDNQEGKLLFFKGENSIRKLKFSFDDKLIATCSWDNKISIWNIEKQRVVQVVQKNNLVQCPTFSPDLKFLAFDSEGSKSIIIQDVVTGNVIDKFQNSSSQSPSLEFSPNGKFLAISKNSNSIELLALIDQNDKQQNKLVGIGPKKQNFHFQLVKEFYLNSDYDQYILSLSFQLSKERNLISGDLKGLIKAHDYLSITGTKTQKDYFINPTLSPTEKILAFGYYSEQNILIWDIDQGGLLFELPSGNVKNKEDPIRLKAFSADGQILACSYKNKINLWNMNTRQMIKEFKHQKKFPKSIVVLSPTKIEIVWTDNSVIEIWTFEKDKQTLKFKVKPEFKTLQSIVQSNCGNLLASCGDRSIKIWDLRSSKILSEMHTQVIRMKIIAFSPDGKILASAGEMIAQGSFQRIILWDANTGESIRIIEIDNLRVEFIKFSPDGQLLACAMNDQTIRVWRLSGSQVSQEPIVIMSNSKYGNYIDFSHDGTKLISSSDCIQIWLIDKQYSDEQQIEFDQQKLKIIPFYAFTNNFDLKADQSTLVGSNIVSNKGANLVSLFLQMGGQR